MFYSSHEDISHPIRSPDAPHTLDLDKNVSFLLKELDALRDANSKVRDIPVASRGAVCSVCVYVGGE